jgi:glutamate 5-kinase
MFFMKKICLLVVSVFLVGLAVAQQGVGGAEIGQAIKTKIQAGNYVSNEGENFQIQEGVQNQIRLKVQDAEAHTDLEIVPEQVQERTKLKVQLSNGRNAEIKIMPDVASERALERLKSNVCSVENNCSIELKEVGVGDQTRAAYEIKAEKQARVFGLFKTKMQIRAEVDAENGEVIRTRKPWWAVIATESDE